MNVLKVLAPRHASLFGSPRTRPGLTLDVVVELVLWCHEHRATFNVLGTGWHHDGTVAVVLVPEVGSLDEGTGAS